MKILLVKPPITVPDDWKGITFFDPPLGLAYVASVLCKEGYDVDILDAGIEGWRKINSHNGRKYVGLSFENISRIIARKAPDVVGITSLSVDASNGTEIARSAKQVNKDIKVVWGGTHATVIPEKVLAEESTDFVVTGEGEYTMLELVRELESPSPDFSRIKGLGYKHNQRLHINPTREWIRDLDQLPLPAHDLLKYPLYFEAVRYLQGARGFHPRRATVITSRGCPYTCNFCSVRQVMGRTYRYRSAENVVREIEILINNYGITNIGFEDDNISLNRARFERICVLIIEKELPVTWDAPNGIRADTLDESLLRKMKKSGCTGINLAPEVGDQDVLENIVGKKLDLESVEEVVQICKDIDLAVGCFFMVGLIGETKHNMQKTVEFACRLRELGAVTFCFIAQPYYGSTLYNQAKEKGYLLRADGEELEKGYINMQAMIETPDFTTDDLYDFRLKVGAGANEFKDIIKSIRNRPLDALRCFLLHPVYISKYLFKNHLIKGTFLRL